MNDEGFKQAISCRSLLIITLPNEALVEVYPQHLIKTGEKHILIAENTKDRCINFFDMDEVLNLTIKKIHSYQPNFSRQEALYFFQALGSMKESKLRPIVKFHTVESIDFSSVPFPCGNPYLTANGEGNLIWAATVDVDDSEMVFKWLKQYDPHVEILNPQYLKKEYASFLKNN